MPRGRTIRATCNECRREGEFEAMYVGSMRPCPNCGRQVYVVDPDTKAYERFVHRCWHCGAEHTGAEPGLAFQLEWWSKQDSDAQGLLVFFGLIGLCSGFLPLIGLAAGLEDRGRSMSAAVGWACVGCDGLVRDASRWFRRRSILCLGLPLIATLVFMTFLPSAAPREPALDWFVRGIVGIIFMAPPALAALLIHRIVFRLMIRPLSEALRAPGAHAIRIEETTVRID